VDDAARVGGVARRVDGPLALSRRRGRNSLKLLQRGVSSSLGAGMRKLGLVISALAIIAAGSADAAEPDRTHRDCKTPDAPYRDYDCLEAYLGDGFLALQLLYLKASESMGNHDSKVVDADSVD
jgi:hypothetical protein